ncbi:flagella protein G [Methanococcus vannielii SB]|jgi:flagellar protein FlaG|uniref:Flagella protein G n=1 Tax=Methanococcus vannielii (strain ATCC 35089 / DSM 1224 / JCM 13029 / OCM 148 / SB) TaxID=406327 RepID=A6UQV4_METVS|nr:flagellar protein G [Methanococcus vannielii]ABR54876.1 flagella protein G [Methanococcus vannielii SB]
MASNVFSEIIIFVSVLIITAAVAGLLATSTHKISLGISSKGDTLSTQLSQDFEIINDPGKIPRDSVKGESTIYVKNTGKNPFSINPDVISVMINGEIMSISNSAVFQSSRTVLRPSEVGEINITYNNSGYHTIRVISEQGVSRTLKGKID